MIGIGVIGYGYWGPNIVRNFQGINPGSVKLICDLNPRSRERAAKANPGVTITDNPDDLFNSKDVDAIAIITPVAAHYPLARKALENGKHIFIEKPFTATVAQGEELLELAAKKNLRIMVDHTFLFTPAVRKIKELIDTNVLGKLYYYDSMRINLGLFQTDVNVMWDLAPHDLSIMHYIMPDKPEAVVATGESHIGTHANMAFITVYLPNSLIAHFNVNWLSPVKMRTTLIGGEKKMLVWNDLVPDEKIRIYDHGVQKKMNPEGIYEMLVSYRMGDVWSPRLEQIEALKSETQYFVKCVEQGETPFNDGEAGLSVVRILEAADKSLKTRGGLVYL
jgi:predicted dehydrogenase